MHSNREEEKENEETVNNNRRSTLVGLLSAPLATVIVISVWLLAGTADRSVVVNGQGESQQGLLVRFSQPETGRSDIRVSRLAALYVAAEDPASPFLTPGPFDASWEGRITISADDIYTFHARGTGSIRLSVGGMPVLETMGRPDSGSVDLATGNHEFRVEYQSPQQGPARMRLMWSGPDFVKEPIPPTALSHNAGGPDLIRSDHLRRARTLWADLSCMQCHQPEDSSRFGEKAMPELARDAPDLHKVGGRLRPGWMQQWIEDPGAMRARATMPHLGLNSRESADIAAWLATLGEPPEPENRAAVSENRSIVSEGGRLYATLGCVACHTLKRPSGTSVDNRLSLSGMAGKWYPQALTGYLLDPSRNYAWTGMPDFQLSDGEASALAAFLLSDGNAATYTPAGGNARRGRRLFMRRGCAGCHSAPADNLLESPSLETLARTDWNQGWLSDRSEGGDHPSYGSLTDDDREALRLLGTEGFASLQRHSPAEFAGRQIRKLDCKACHTIDGQGDRLSDLEEEVSHLTPDDENLPFDFAQRRPPLTWAGEKLQPSWLRGLLEGTLDHRARPWLQARMPAVGARPALMSQGLVEMHGLDSQNFQLDPPDPEMVSTGRRLARGLGNGFFCQSCHHGGAGGGFPAPNLDLLAERLRPGFFRWMMHSPRRVDPNTAMPAFADARGRTRYLDTFNGDAGRQFEAIWNYLLQIRAGYPTDQEGQEPETNWAGLFQKMKKGPFYSGIIDAPEEEVKLEVDPRFGYVTSVPDEGHLNKGMSIRVGVSRQAAVHFDHDLLRMSAGWTGDFLEFRSNHDRGIRNMPPPGVAGEIRFSSPSVFGWSEGDLPQFTDPRKRSYGPIPKEQGQYKGLYQHGDRVVLSYSVAESPVLESPWYLQEGSTGAFVRDLQVGAHEEPLSVLLYEGTDELRIEKRNSLLLARTEFDGRVRLAAVLDRKDVNLVKSEQGHPSLRFSPKPTISAVRVLIWEGPAEREDEFLAMATSNGEPTDLEQLSEPGPARWGKPLITHGEPGEPQGAWAVDRLTTPTENRYGALFHFTDLDFLDDGRAVLTTMHGDVWLVSGLSENLEKLEWQRYATGLNHPFGVRVVEGKIYVSTDDELTVLHDRDGNGEADYFESFRNLFAPRYGAWRHAFGLEIDSSGNFYFARGRGINGTEWENGVFRISSDGSRMESIAAGFRQPWGIGISPEGHVTVSQQEGTWVPQTPVNIIDLEHRKGRFYGFSPDRYRREDPYPRERGYEPPMVYIPRTVDNSGAGQAWVRSDRWGLPRGQMLHFSYGQGTVLQVLNERVGPDWQAGVVPVIRLEDMQPRTGRFRPHDGQLYVVGLQSGGFRRVRYTGKKVYLPIALHAHENGIRLRFNEPLNTASAGNKKNYSIYRWNYRWSDDYGSGYYSVKNQDLFGEDVVELISAVTSDDGREVFLEVPEMVPVDQMRIEYSLKTADGTSIANEIHSTVHALRPPFRK